MAKVSAGQLELAASQGWIPYEWWWPSIQTYASEDLALTAIRIHVPVQLTMEAEVSGTCTLSLSTSGSEGATFLLQWSADLIVWHDLGRVAPAGQVVRVSDTAAVPTEAKFYRLILVE